MSKQTLDVFNIREQFPILNQRINNKPLIYFDNAATSQKPQAVIDSIVNYYQNDNANVHRGIHELSERATYQYENTRDKILEFINANDRTEIVYTRGATEAINLISQCYISKLCKKGDAIVISELEHHANIVPWQILSQKLGIEIRWLPVNDRGELKIECLHDLCKDGKVKLLTFNWISNSLGTINPCIDLVTKAKEFNILTLIDACQVPSHFLIDVQKVGCDFLVYSGHKMFASTGIGILWAKKELLENFDYWHGGGEMIIEVTFNNFTPNELPNRLEAGTPAIAEVISLGKAIDWLKEINLHDTHNHEQKLLQLATDGLSEINDVRLVGQAKEKVGIVSFVFESNNLHASDIATFLNLDGVATRSGHHCTMPILKKMGLPATVRASFAMFNTEEEIEFFVKSVYNIQKKYG